MSKTVSISCPHQLHRLEYYVTDDGGLLECPVCLRLEYYRHKEGDKVCVHFECGWSMIVNDVPQREQQKQLYRDEKLDRQKTPNCIIHKPASHPVPGFSKICPHGLLHTPHYCTCCGKGWELTNVNNLSSQVFKT